MNRFDSKKQVRLPGLLFSIILFSLLIFLASDQARFITGQVIAPNGGIVI